MQLVISTELTLCSLRKFITKFHYKAGLSKILNLCICQIHIYVCVIRIKSRMYLYCLVTLVIYSKQYNLLRSLLCCFLQSLPPQVFPPVLKQPQSKQIARHCRIQLYLLEKQFCFSISCVPAPLGLSLVFCPQKERGSFIPAQNSNYSCSSAHFSLQSGKAQSLLDLTPIPTKDSLPHT